jgi:hypothetical protein
MLWRSRPEENGKTSDAYMEYGLPPPGRIKPRRDGKMAEKQVHTMAKAEKVAPHEESGSSWNRELPKETIGHIQSAGCLGQKEVVTAAHNACIRELLQEVNVHGKADRHMKLFGIFLKGHNSGSRAVHEFANGSTSGRSSQRVEGTTDCVCGRDVRICSC